MSKNLALLKGIIVECLVLVAPDEDVIDHVAMRLAALDRHLMVMELLNILILWRPSSQLDWQITALKTRHL
jgi:hypothetical protein